MKGCVPMKLTYRTQAAIMVIIILVANILSDVRNFWLYRSLGFGICGLLWIIHPVVPDGMKENNQTIFWTRIAGIILILIGVFTRVHY